MNDKEVLVMNWSNWSKKERILGGSLAVLLVLLGISWFHTSPAKNQEDSLAWEDAAKPEASAEQKNEKPDQRDEPKTVVVDVKGAVGSPGVYEVKTDQRVVDVIEQAGGFQKKADQKQINLAQRVGDEMVIYVPKIGEEVKNWTGGGEGSEQGNGSSQGNGKVAINSAKESDLDQLPGIGPAKAKAIIDYRKKNGPFKKVGDLVNVSGIGEKTLEKLKDQIRL